MPKEEKYALYKVGRPEDTFPKLTRHAYCMTNRLNGHPVWVPKSIVMLDPPDELGVRIEDMVVIAGNHPRNLTQYEKAFTILPENIESI